jgi:hypothetical protein
VTQRSTLPRCRYCGRAHSQGHELQTLSLLVERSDGPFRGVRLLSDRPRTEMVTLCTSCRAWISTCRFCRWFERASSAATKVSGRCLWEQEAGRPGESPYRKVREPPTGAPSSWPLVTADSGCDRWDQDKPVKGGWL